MKDIWKANKEKVINKKKIIISIIIFIIIALIATSIIMYICNKTVRDWIDKNIYRKEVMQDNVTTIELKDENSNVYAFNKYIGILNKSELTIYNNTGSKEKSIEVQISNPIFDSANRFLAIAESKGKRLYVISDKDEIWNAQVDGDIAQVHINKNGYVAVVIVNTSYKTVVVMYDPQGKELFKTYLSSTRTADVSISNDNKYLAIAEVDTSGSISDEELEDFFSEIYYLWKSGVKVTIAQMDTKIEHIEEYNGKFNNEIYGRGGTEFTDLINYYNERKKDFSTLVIFTDGYVSLNLPPFRNGVWVITKNGQHQDYPGTTIYIPNNAN